MHDPAIAFQLFTWSGPKSPDPSFTSWYWKRSVLWNGMGMACKTRYAFNTGRFYSAKPCNPLKGKYVHRSITCVTHFLQNTVSVGVSRRRGCLDTRWKLLLSTCAMKLEAMSRHPHTSLGTRPSENRKKGLGDRLGSKCTKRNVWIL